MGALGQAQELATILAIGYMRLMHRRIANSQQNRNLAHLELMADAVESRCIQGLEEA